MAWERVGKQLRCKEHDERFPIGRRCPACPRPGSGRSARDASPVGDSAPLPQPVERAAAAAFLANAPARSDGHPLASREGRIAAAAELYDQAEAAIGDGLQQPQMNAIKEARQCIALAESLAEKTELAKQVAELAAKLDAVAKVVGGSLGDEGGVDLPIADEGAN